MSFFHGRQELVRNIGSFEKLRVQKKRRITLKCLTEANPKETCHGSKNRKFVICKKK